MIKGFEGLKLTAYLDMVGVPTIGWGCTAGVTKDDVTNGRTITLQQAEDMLAGELSGHQSAVESYVTVSINDNQFGALVSFAYNLGNGALHGSHLLTYLNAGNASGAADEFLKWDHAGGKQVSGLTRRRQAERSLFLKSMPSGGQLPDGPSDQDIENKLKDIENGV